VRRELAPLLLCPACREGGLVPGSVEKESWEMEEGDLRCERCGERFEVRGGIADLLYRPSLEVQKEMEAWSSFRPDRELSEEERESSRAWLRGLPFLEGLTGPVADLETWRRHGRSVFELCGGMQWEGRRVLELGAGRCWLSAHLARLGARVVAVDILEADYIGLGSAQVFLEEGVRFDRLLCDMHRLPFKPDSFDAVVATATLHHSHDPLLLLEEARRVLKCDGLLLAANEPLYVPWRKETEEERRGAHEGAYTLRTWRRYLRESGYNLIDLRLGRDASLNLKASPAAPRRALPRGKGRAAALSYARILALAPPRRMGRAARDVAAAWPMRPRPRLGGGYIRARMGRKELRAKALPDEQANWGPGWYRPEGGEEPFRWSGPRCRLILPRPEGEADLVLELSTFHPDPRAHPATVEVFVGRSRAGTISVDRRGWRKFRVKAAPGSRRRAVPVTLRVRSGCFLPRDMGLGEDDRLLGVACRGAWWEPSA